jgi:very-short-patch-repair endonuclease
MTKSERIFWEAIRWDILWERVLRQKIFYAYTEYSWLDRFIIPDFYIAKKKLIIEIDWSIHKVSDVLKLDKVKEELILNKWFDIIRFTNNEIEKDIGTVIQKIKQKLT